MSKRDCINGVHRRPENISDALRRGREVHEAKEREATEEARITQALAAIEAGYKRALAQLEAEAESRRAAEDTLIAERQRFTRALDAAEKREATEEARITQALAVNEIARKIESLDPYEYDETLTSAIARMLREGCL